VFYARRQTSGVDGVHTPGCGTPTPAPAKVRAAGDPRLEAGCCKNPLKPDGNFLSLPRMRGTVKTPRTASEIQPRTAPSKAVDGCGSGRRIMRNALTTPMRAARRVTTSAT
jgi:hypothetical protein